MIHLAQKPDSNANKIRLRGAFFDEIRKIDRKDLLRQRRQSNDARAWRSSH
jgi:hypothetical protein